MSKKRRPGRNDACPCGSGKKYKRCCLGKAPSDLPTAGTTAAGAARGLGMQQIVQLTRDWPEEITAQVLGLIQAQDLDAMAEELAKFPRLLAPGAPLSHFRYDANRLADACDEALERGVDPDADNGHELFQACIDSIATPDLVQRLVQESAALVGLRELPEEAWLVAATVAMSTAMVAADEAHAYRIMPALNILFRVQLRESARAMDRLIEQHSSALGAEAGEPTTPVHLIDQLAADPELRAQLESDPLMMRQMSRELDQCRARVDALIANKTLPPVLTVPEVLMLTSLAMLLDEQDRIQSQDEHRDQQHTALAQGLFQAMDGMKITLIERLMGIASDPELPKPHQQTHRDVAKALLGDPQRVIFAAFAQASEGAVVIRDEGEIERTSDLPPARDIRPSHLAPLRELLVSLEDTAGVDTVDQACRNIEERLALEVQSSGDTTA